MNPAPERVYQINSSGYWHTGHTSDGNQILFGLYCPDLVAYVFNAAGDLVETQKRPLDFLLESSPPYNIYNPRIELRQEAWKQQLGVRSGLIRVHKFLDNCRGIGIEDYPEYFDLATEPSNISDGMKSEIEESRRTWEKEGNFVLRWGNDYWLDRNGEIESS